MIRSLAGWVGIAATALAMAPAGPALAQSAEDDKAVEAGTADALPEIIIVTGEGRKRKQVVVGSRIPQRPLFGQGQVATNTGTPGLVPQSGMDPMGGYTRTITVSECVSDREGISEAAACRLVAALQAEQEGDMLVAAGILNTMASDEAFAPPERYAAAEHLYRVAQLAGKDVWREVALEHMLESGQLPDDQAQSARRTLVAMALADGRRELARERLENVVARDPADAASLANLAQLQEEGGLEAAGATMQRAIDAALASGQDVPQGWRDFATRLASAGA